jgi:hypothetical protein
MIQKDHWIDDMVMERDRKDQLIILIWIVKRKSWRYRFMENLKSLLFSRGWKKDK